MLKMEKLLILFFIELFLASTGFVASEESFSSSSASAFSSAQSLSTSDSSSASAYAYSDGYSESDNYKENTPLKCKKNEIFDFCPPKCPLQKCGVDASVIFCPRNPKLGDPECEPRCRCIDGFYRNDFGDCIPKHQCPPKFVCGPNEQYSSCVNGGCRRWSCSQTGILCIDPIVCRKGCRCKDKYVRADNGICIPENQCPLKCYGQNEVPGCEDNCPPQTCESIGKHYSCPLKPVNAPCKPVCRCKPGYFRNKIGECIAKNDCLKCTGPHEYFSCGSACDNECYNLSQQNQTHCPIINIKCNKKCYCEDGYARNSRNICVPYAKCPLKCYGQNEVPGCEVNCPPQTCESIGKHYYCPLQHVNPPCKTVCRCKPGYFRNKIGNCISKHNCLKCTGPHEYFSCGPECDNECYNLSKQNQTNCPYINIKCNDKCYCENGYARNNRKICVPFAKCPPETIHQKRNENNKYI